MSIKLCQAANSVVTPLDDAQLYSWIANRAVGVVAGCAVTSAGTNQLSVAAGWGIVQGHVFTISAQTISAAVAPSGTVNGRLLIRIDTSDTVTPVEFITQATTPLPALTQEDIDSSGSIYELPLATYTVGTISVSGLTNVAPTAVAPMPRGWSQFTIPTPTVSGNARTYTFDFSGKKVSDICLYILGIGYAVFDVRCLPGLLEFKYYVNYQDDNVTSRTIVTGVVTGNVLTVTVDTKYTSAPSVYSVLNALYYR